MQAYTVFLATFISLWRKQLSIADAHFVFTITISPVFLYLIYSIFHLVMRKSTTLYQRLGSSKRWTAFWSTLILVIWIVLECIIYFAPDHVFEGQRCAIPTFEGWLFYRLLTDAVAFEISSFFSLLFSSSCIPFTRCGIARICTENTNDIREML